MDKFSLWLDGMLALTALMLVIFGKFGATRQLAFLPLLTATLDGTFVSEIAASLTPVLSAVLWGLQGVILAFSGWMLYQDRIRFRNKQLRRRREKQLARSRCAFEQAAEEAEQSRRTALRRANGQICA